MTQRRAFALGLVVVASLYASPVAEALTFRFEDPHALAPNGTPDSCFNGDRCGDELSFTREGVTVTASAFGFANAVIQDLNPDHSGLGAVWHVHDHYFDFFGDEVNWGQGLLLTFDVPVALQRVHFRSEDHGPHFGPCDTFAFSTDGESWDTMGLGGSVGFEPHGPVSTTFYFKYGGWFPEDFYIARIRVEPQADVIEEVPEPGTLALLGAGLVGLARRAQRRRRGAASVRAGVEELYTSSRDSGREL